MVCWMNLQARPSQRRSIIIEGRAPVKVEDITRRLRGAGGTVDSLPGKVGRQDKVGDDGRWKEPPWPRQIARPLKGT